MNLTLPFPLAVNQRSSWHFDLQILLPVLGLLTIGLVMVASASFSFAEHKFGDEFFFVKRHLVYLLLSAVSLLIGYMVPTSFWKRYSLLWILLSFILLVVVLIVGREINGSRRWISIAGFTLQVSELVKVAMVVFLANYLEQHREALQQNWKEIGRPLGVLVLFAFLLILEPDFGSVVVLTGTVMAMLFLGGARLWQYLVIAVIGGVLLWWMAESAPYRMDRLTAFLDPWADQFNTGYQLTQSLIAFGRGEWFGVGLGQSMQKMLYLPEAHTDFVFAIFAEEFGFVGVLCLLALYIALVTRILGLGKKAISRQQWYSAFALIGFALLVSGQTFINLGVNSGLLPTKGLTLPFVSYGGSSLLVSCAMIGMILRISQDIQSEPAQVKGVRRGR